MQAGESPGSPGAPAHATAADAMTAGQEWRAYWPIVAAGMAGMVLSTIPSATLGVFMAPLEKTFGWSRTEISFGLTIFAFVSLPLTPFAGMLVDKFGPRRVAIPGLAISAASFAAFSLLDGSLIQWLALWVVYTLGSLLTRTLVWNKAVSGAFSASRGLAIAVLLCGTAIAQSLAPAAARWLIDGWDWRTAYLALGLGWGGVALILTLLFFHEARGPEQSGDQAAAPRMIPGGLTLKQALRSSPMRRIALAMFLMCTMGAAIMVHLVPMLTADGLSASEAVGVVAVLGVASIAGKLLTGWLIDRISGSLLPVMAFGGPALAYAILLQAGGSIPLLSLAVAIMGYSSGASLQLATYLTTRYVGLRHFATIFGVISSLMAAAAGIGPLMAAQIFDNFGSYAPLLMIGVGAASLAGAAVFKLGPYPTFAPVGVAAPETEPAEKAATA